MDYDTELGRHHAALRRAWEVGPADRVLDLGCGAGQTTREAARLASDGWVYGVDVSKEMIAKARLLAEGEGLHNVAFACADAQDHPFPSEPFDRAVSRFGTMFFRDPVAAFTHIGRSLRRDGQLVMMVWQSHERNEWSVAIERALATAVLPSAGLDPFSLADPATVRRVLDAAGFADIAFTDVHEPVWYGRDVAAALAWVGGFACTRSAVEHLDPTARARALEPLRETLAAHAREDGVWFDSRAWIVNARRS